MYFSYPIFLFFLTDYVTQVEETRVFPLPKVVNRQRIYPGIKDLPQHIRMDFRNIFIRLAIRDVFNSKEPWINPDLHRLQRLYDGIYPEYPARLQSNDAVFHPVSPDENGEHWESDSPTDNHLSQRCS